MKEEIGIIGLGKMGANVARRLLDAKWKVYGYNRTYSVAKEMEQEGLTAVQSLREMVDGLQSPRVVWLMVPAGDPVDEMLFGGNGQQGLADLLEAGDIVVDGGNSFYVDDEPRAKKLAQKNINFIDVGVSGGPGGARNGACLMIGGDQKSYEQLEPVFKVLSNGTSYQFFPGMGAGHFVKMVHNGIEYGMMQAIAEGMAVMKAAPFNFNLQDVAKIYQNGSVIESRLVGWLESGYKEYGVELEPISSTVKSSGEGHWTVETAKSMSIDVPVLEDSIKFRDQSADNPSYIGKVLMALRNQFGGHAIVPEEKK